MDNKKATWVSIFLILLAVIILGVPTLIYPFGRDQSEYAWIATSTLNGNLCYRDIFNVKPPCTHLVHAIALMLFGYKMVSIRILDLLWQGITAILIFKIAKEMKYPFPASVLAAVLYLFSYYRMDYWTTAQTDGFITLPIAVAILLFLYAQQRKSRWFYVSSGMAIGLAILFKYPIGILLAFLMLLIIIKLKRDCIFPIMIMGAGFIFPLATGALIMFTNGNLADFLWTQYKYIPGYATISHDNLNYINILELGIRTVLIPLIIGWYVFFIGPHRSHRLQMAVTITWWISAVIHLVIQNKFYAYHAIPTFAPIALMSGNIFVGSIRTRSRAHFALCVLAVFVIVIPFFAADFPQKYIRLWDVVGYKIPLQTMYSNKAFQGEDYSCRADIQVAEYLITHTKKDEKVFIWGFEPGIYFLSQRSHPTRFAYNFLLYGPKSNPELRKEFINEIQTQEPVYIAIVSNDAMFHVTATEDDSWNAYSSFDEFRSFVSKNYRYEISIEHFTLYKLDPLRITNPE